MTPEQLQQLWASGQIVALAGPARRDQEALAAAVGPGGLGPLLRQWGPGVVLGSGGSSGERRWCLQPLAHLQAAAVASGHWLEARGLEPGACLHLNPLPLHHVSGLLPWVRAQQWGAGHRRLDPAWMRDPTQVAAAVPLDPGRPALLSLVPTQLQRLMAAPEGVAWLQQLAVVWVGGAPLPPQLAAQARQAGLRLAPCYGATETAAMVCALPPERFLAGVAGCGAPLADVELRLAASGAVEVTCGRLSPGWLEHGTLRPLPRTAEGWWRSGDAGRLGPAGLELLGRLDSAIHSGGETVFPEPLEARLRAAAQAVELPVEALLLLAVDDLDWGQRLVALVRPSPGALPWPELHTALEALCASWAPAERPWRWLLCPELAPTALGKWQRTRWRAWVGELEAVQTPTSAAADVDPL
ncbi:AMP-binding protein [Cyanobium sp. FACHB-13342]|uniref:AMP-binding protein n=1 Tax=Cyanobium sp. FACHB-13342 TaxID=2692793 RepID=UPI001680F280|nr:AMP-binding protein [Cyanobium sp. FACHB-13342]MBD2423969.1 AMP-binding protein [Cyanobium sp. FACHB-13342]